MYRVGATVSAVILAGGVVGVTMLGGASEPQITNADREVEQFEGRIVNLYFHMTEPEEYWDNDNDNGNGVWDDDNDNDMQRDRPRRPDRGQMMRDAQNPLAIVVEEDRLIGSTTNTYVLIFEPDGMQPGRPGARPGQEPGARPGQQPRQQGGQPPHDRDRDRDRDWDDDNDLDRPTNDMAREQLAEQLRQHVGEHVTIHGAKHEREDLTVILVQRIDDPAEQRPAPRRPGEPREPREPRPGQPR